MKDGKGQLSPWYVFNTNDCEDKVRIKFVFTFYVKDFQ